MPLRGTVLLQTVLHLDVFVLLQTLLPLDVFVLQQFVVPLDHVSVLRQLVLSLDLNVSVLPSCQCCRKYQLYFSLCCPWGCVFYSKLCCPGRICSTAAVPPLDVLFLNMSGGLKQPVLPVGVCFTAVVHLYSVHVCLQRAFVLHLDVSFYKSLCCILEVDGRHGFFAFSVVSGRFETVFFLSNVSIKFRNTKTNREKCILVLRNKSKRTVTDWFTVCFSSKRFFSFEDTLVAMWPISTAFLIL